MTQPAIVRVNMIVRMLPVLAIIACQSIAAVAWSQETSPDADTGLGIPEVQRINEEIRKVWVDYELSPSAKATDGEWCRRVYLDVIGRVPSVQELNEFRNSSDLDKRQKLVNTLLYDEDFTEIYASNWTTLWTNVLIGRSGGSERNSLTNRAGLQKYLRDSLARNKPYDKIAYELVTATGSNTPGMEEFNGAVNFLTMKLTENATQATAETSKVFLGLQVQCTQCHNLSLIHI